MLVETTYADIVDRYIICYIKYDKTGSEEALKQKEYLEQFVEAENLSPKEVRLYEIHLKLWDAEDYIREGIREGKLSASYKWAKTICLLNDERSAIKKELGSKEDKYYKEKENE